MLSASAPNSGHMWRHIPLHIIIIVHVYTLSETRLSSIDMYEYIGAPCTCQSFLEYNLCDTLNLCHIACGLFNKLNLRSIMLDTFLQVKVFK